MIYTYIESTFFLSMCRLKRFKLPDYPSNPLSCTLKSPTSPQQFPDLSGGPGFQWSAVLHFDFWGQGAAALIQ